MSKMPLAIGHRGVSAYAPENTIPSYQLAASIGTYWGVECDIHETLDGEFILLHDDTLDDTTDAEELFPHKRRFWSVRASDLTLAEIRQLTVRDRSKPPAYENVAKYGIVRVPALAEYLEVCVQSGMVPVIEVKQLENAQRFLAVLDAYSLRHSCLILSFEVDAIKQLIALDDKLNIQLLFSFGNRISERELDSAVALGCRGVDVHYNSVNEEMVRQAHARSLEVNAWESRPPFTRERIERLVACGVDYITADKPLEWILEEREDA